jgi:hypothetical protein
MTPFVAVIRRQPLSEKPYTLAPPVALSELQSLRRVASNMLCLAQHCVTVDASAMGAVLSVSLLIPVLYCLQLFVVADVLNSKS